jgi:hypothetical protein
VTSPILAYDFFDCLFGIDAREEGFDVVAVLYSTSTGNRMMPAHALPRWARGADLPDLTGVYRGADWHERETWDMFGIEFTDHPASSPASSPRRTSRASRCARTSTSPRAWPSPGPVVKEPAELDEDGNVIERVPRIGDAPGPYELDKAMAEQAKLANPAPETPRPRPRRSRGRSPSPRPRARTSPRPSIDQATYDALIAEGKSERIARSKAKAAFVKKQRQQAADDASDQAAETESGQAVEQDAERAEVAEDSGQVLSGDVEQQAEEAETQATEAAEAGRGAGGVRAAGGRRGAGRGRRGSVRGGGVRDRQGGDQAPRGGRGARPQGRGAGPIDAEQDDDASDQREGEEDA